MLVAPAAVLALLVAGWAAPEDAAAAAIAGQVVDAKDQPVAGADVYLSWGELADGTVPVLARAKTDAQGKFHLALPRAEEQREFSPNLRAMIAAYVPGQAVTALALFGSQLLAHRTPVHLALGTPSPHVVTLQDASGKPIAGARVAPRLFYLDTGTSLARQAVLPDELADRLSAQTGPDGRASLPDMPAVATIDSFRITIPGLGTQVVPQSTDGADAITISVKPGGRLSGKVLSPEGQPLADQAVEIWARALFESVPVQFESGPVRMAADGTFQVPAGLLAGQTYSAWVRRTDRDVTSSDWITMTGADATLPPLVVHPLRTISGRVIDRQGAPVADAEVFQLNDGPRPTSTKTDAQGRFQLGGFRTGRVVICARKEGYRFQGKLVDRGITESDITMARTGEPPIGPTATLPDVMPLEERRALARKLLAAPLKETLRNGTDPERLWGLIALAETDPAQAVEILDSNPFQNPNRIWSIRQRLAMELARTDPEEAIAVAEPVQKPELRALVFLRVYDALPEATRKRRADILDRIVVDARASDDVALHVSLLGDVGERWLELGNAEKARPCFDEGKALVKQMASTRDQDRADFAARVSQLDLPAALAIAEAVKDPREQSRAYAGIAARIAAGNPAEAERLLGLIPAAGPHQQALNRVCRALGPVDFPRANRLARSSLEIGASMHLIFLADGLAAHNRALALQALQDALAAADETNGPSVSMGATLIMGLPLVERIEPTMLPDFFWRAVAHMERAPDPRRIWVRDLSSAFMGHRLSRYDRDVAEMLFEPLLDRVKSSTDEARGTMIPALAREFTTVDPRRAVSLVESLPSAPQKPARRRTNMPLFHVVSALARPLDDEWRRTWTWLYDRDLGP